MATRKLSPHADPNVTRTRELTRLRVQRLPGFRLNDEEQHSLDEYRAIQDGRGVEAVRREEERVSGEE